MGTYKKNIASSFVIQIVKIILGFITSILIARGLGADGKGYTAYAVLIFGLLGGYGHLGINNATTYFQKKSEFKEENVYNTNISYLLVVWVMISIAVIILKRFNIFLQDYDLFFILFGLLFVLLTFLMTCVNAFYIGNEKISEANKYILISSIIYSSIIIGLYFIRVINIYTFFGLQILSPLINVVMLIKNINIKFKFQIEKELLKKEFKYGIIIYFSALFIFLNYRVDQIMIKNMLDNVQLGIYSVGVNLAELLFLVPDSVTTALLGKLYNTENLKDKKEITSTTTKYTFYISLILSLIGILLTPAIPLIYGREYYASIYVTIILFIGIIFASLGRVSYSYFFSEGRPVIHLGITFITLVINVLFNIILIPRLGINGSAFASTISYTLYGAMYIFVFTKMEGFKLRQFFLFNEYDKQILYKLKKTKEIVYNRSNNDDNIKQ